MDRVNHMRVKFIWGNSNYQYVSSDSAGSSGGMLCVWEVTIFKKDYATISDNFIAIYETWISNNSKSSSRLFNHFITSSWLVDVKLEGYSFTWAHPSATKMSKPDRFLVSEDYGPILFCFYHSWFKWDGFDVMVKQAWNSFSHSDTNGLIRFKKKLQDLKKVIRNWIKDKKLQQLVLLIPSKRI
nr:hypothetical protein [Tanacetum cinerariifolium]